MANSFRSSPVQPSLPEPGLVSVEAWAHLPWLRAAFSTRAPGASRVYQPASDEAGEQNLGLTHEDDPDVVHLNRRRFVAAVSGQADMALVLMRQVHSGIVRDLSEPEDRRGRAQGERAPLQGDGMVSARAGILLGILTADCVPVLVADARTRTVAAFHAGWRGTLAGIVEHGIDLLRSRHGSHPADLIAAIGPAIRPCCFEVGEEVRSAFLNASSDVESLFRAADAAGKWHLDLQEANRRQLLQAGLAPEQVHTIAECTACSRTSEGRRRYFSYRAEGGVTGRMLSVIGAAEM